MNTRESVLLFLSEGPMTLKEMQQRRKSITMARLLRMEEAGEITRDDRDDPYTERGNSRSRWEKT